MMISTKYHRFEVWLINLDPTVGCEIKKTRPCLIISPDEMNFLKTLIVAPMTSKGFEAPSRVPCVFQSQPGLIVLDQIRTVDKIRFVKKLGIIHAKTQKKVCNTLIEMFSL